jgi:hypothetical protein
MMIVFEVHLAPGAGPVELLSQETLKETQAQVMTFDEARQVGFGGLPQPPPDRDVRFIAVAQRDSPWVRQRLEANEQVAGYKVHEVD